MRISILKADELQLIREIAKFTENLYLKMICYQLSKQEKCDSPDNSLLLCLPS